MNTIRTKQKKPSPKHHQPYFKMHLPGLPTLLLSSLLAVTAVSAYQGGYYEARDLSARDAYPDAYPDAYAYADDDFSLYSRDAEPDFDGDGLVARDAYLDGYIAGLAKRDAVLDDVLQARGNMFSKPKDDKPDYMKDLDKWDKDDKRKKKQKDLDKYLAEQQKKEDKRRKKEEKKGGK